MDTTGETEDLKSTNSSKRKGKVVEASFPRGGIVTARGTGDGLIIRLDCRARAAELHGALEDFLASRKGFLSGTGVYLEWIGNTPEQTLIDRVKETISGKYNIKVLESRAKANDSSLDDAPSGIAPIRRHDDLFSSDDVLHADDEGPGLFDGMRDTEMVVGDGQGRASAKVAEIWDDPDARVVYGMLRSGQKIETEHSIVICGDVNSGADVVAGGDIIVLGTLRGVAHAGAYDETGGGRFIFALDLKPTQLRIGTVISRGAEEKSSVPEIARIEGNNIVVEKYRSRVNPRAL